MAYDENGNYYFDPNSDIDDAEVYHDEVRREQIRNAVKSQQAIQKEQNDFNTLWSECLGEFGIDQRAYNERYNADPVKAKTYLKQAMQHVAKNVSRDAQGRFTKQQPQTPQSKSVQERREREQASPKSLDSYHETVKQRPLAYEEELDIINILFPDPI